MYKKELLHIITAAGSHFISCPNCARSTKNHWSKLLASSHSNIQSLSYIWHKSRRDRHQTTELASRVWWKMEKGPDIIGFWRLVENGERVSNSMTNKWFEGSPTLIILKKPKYGEEKAVVKARPWLPRLDNLGTMVKTKLAAKSDSNKCRNVRTRRKPTTNVKRGLKKLVVAYVETPTSSTPSATLFSLKFILLFSQIKPKRRRFK
uniref:Uncharacterized protein n=1 Tax=Cucumis melo TaxID=3656 RepID=A0A9I9E8J0_CUCME